MPRLIVMCGLPGTGKTTVSRPLARRLRAAYLRVDSIEQAIASSPMAPVEVVDHGYRVACAVAADNLRQGLDVVAECVNPLTITREAWQAVSHAAGAAHHDVELVCSDTAAHRQRVETRTADIVGLSLPGWHDVEARHYEPWTTRCTVIDTAVLTPVDTVEEILRAIS